MGKKRNKKQQPSMEDRARISDHKLKRFISDSAINLAKDDPEAKRQMISQIYGFPLLDQDEKSKKELKSFLFEITKKRIKEDPNLERKITDAVIRKLMEEYGFIADGDEWRKKPPSLDDMIENFKKVQEIKEIVRAGKPGWLETLMSPESVTAILSILGQVINTRQSSATPVEFVWVQIEGKDELIPRELLEKLKADGKVKSLEDLELVEPDNHNKGDDTTSESETPSETKGENEEAGTGDSGA